MKYKAISQSEPQTFTVKSLDGGLKTSGGSLADNQLSDCRNVWFHDGALKTRPGLHCEESQILLDDLDPLDDFLGLKMTDTVFSHNGKLLTLAYAMVCRENSFAYLYVYGIAADKSLTSLGSILFHRTAYDCFYQPYSALFYTGKPVEGGGLFAFVSVKNLYDEEEKYYNIFEIDDTLDGWTQIYNYYVPTVYINGRGTRYELAKSVHQAFTGQPTVLESPNLLGGRFHAYFTSDGYSSAFRLPFAGLSDEVIVGRFYRSLTEYTEWRIFPGTSSDTQYLYSASVTMTADRQKGIVYFTDSQGDYPLPIMIYYYENNLRITAGKKEPGCPESIASCRCCTAFHSRILFSGGTEPGMIYTASYANPLYFPKSAAYAAGTTNQPVTALKLQGNRILAFQKDGLLSLRLVKGKQLNTKSLLADNDAIFYDCDSLVETRINGGIGCDNPDTVAACGNDTVWMGSDGAIYAISSSGSLIHRISNAIQPTLAALSQKEKTGAFALGRVGGYFLIIGSKAIIMEYKPYGLKSPDTPGRVRWFLWQFPDSLTVKGATEKNGSILFLCHSGFPGIGYLAELRDGADTYFRPVGSTVEPVSSAILSSFTTKEFDFGSALTRKRVENILLSLAAGGEASLQVNGKQLEPIRKTQADTAQHLTVRRLYPSLNGCRFVSLTLSSDKALTVGELSLLYREIP